MTAYTHTYTGETAIVLINPYGVQLVDSTIDIGLKGELVDCLGAVWAYRQRATTS